MQTFLLKLGVRLLKKVNFFNWTILEDKKYSCIQAVEDGASNFPELLCDYLSTALPFSVDFSKVPWQYTIKAFYDVHSVISAIKKIPLTSYTSKEKEEKDPWEYSGRLWFFYCNLIASAYSWSSEKIAKLPVDDALSFIQEILTSQYLDKEFVWSTSEKAYSYSKDTQKIKYIPLPKPYWMKGKTEEKRKAPPIPKALLPVGNVINLYAPEDFKFS